MNLAILKKYIVLEICGIAILAALAFIGLKLFMAHRLYADESRALDDVTNEKKTLEGGKIYPSPENIKRETENFKDILANYTELNELVRAKQIEPRAMAAADFIPLWESTLLRIRRKLSEAHVAYPLNYTFGFERYASGKLPAGGDIPRLVQQLQIIEALCLALARVGVADLVSISREEFEGAAVAGKPADKRAAEPLYTNQHFKLEVRGEEAALVELLNLLARCPMFTVVTVVELANEKAEQREGAAAAPAPVAAPVPGTPGAGPADDRDQRIVLGREQVRLKLELDVYQFAPLANSEGGAGKKTAR